MRFVRVIHPTHIDSEYKRATNLAFKNSSKERGGGISTFEYDCAIRASGSVCQHIKNYYPSPISGDPILYWIIPDDPIFNDSEWKPKVSAAGDICHYNLEGLSNNKAEKFVKKQSLAAFSLCVGQTARPLRESDLPF